MKKIGFYGLGIMGASMVRNLMKAGYDLKVYNRTREKTEQLESEGAGIADSLEGLVDGADICCSCVTNSDALYAIFDQINDEVAWPEYWIDFSTIAPSEAKVLFSKFSEKGVVFVDAPVTGGDVGARNGTLSIMVEDVFSELAEVFQAVGKNIVSVGPSGSGQLTKCVNQLMCAISIAAMTEGLVLAEGLGLDPEKTLQVVKGGAAGSWAIENYAPRLFRNEFGPGFYARDQVKDLRFVIAELEKAGLELPVTQLVTELYEKFAVGEGQQLGNHALIKLYAKQGE